MISNLPQCSMFLGASASGPGGHGTVYLLAAVSCLLIALRFWRRAIQPVDALVRAVAAAAMVAFATCVAFVLLIAAVLSLH